MLNLNNVSSSNVQLGNTEKYSQSSGERNTYILLYLKKFDGDWKNTREIATYSGRSVQHRGRLEDILEQLVTRELILKRDAENPQAKFEYKISPKGKEKLSTYRILSNDPDLKFMLGIKEDTKFDEV